MPLIADIAAPDRMRRLGLAWFVTPLFLVAIWLLAVPQNANQPHHLPSNGIAAGR